MTNLCKRVVCVCVRLTKLCAKESCVCVCMCDKELCATKLCERVVCDLPRESQVDVTKRHACPTKHHGNRGAQSRVDVTKRKCRTCHERHVTELAHAGYVTRIYLAASRHCSTSFPFGQWPGSGHNCGAVSLDIALVGRASSSPRRSFLLPSTAPCTLATPQTFPSTTFSHGIHTIPTRLPTDRCSPESSPKGVGS